MRLITKNNAMSNAFTLAEVLITLAIIGVVAAMTMPTLINNTNGAQFKTAYKKALSVLSQAVVMNIALDDYDLAGTSAESTLTDGKFTGTSVGRMFQERTNGTLLKSGEISDWNVYLSSDGNTVSGTAESDIATNNYVFRFQDGIIFTFANSAAGCTEAAPCKGFIDANGTKGPNKQVVCQDAVEGGECPGKVTVNDIYPIKFYDQTVAPNSAAARAVLYGAENKDKDTGTTPETSGDDGE